MGIQDSPHYPSWIHDKGLRSLYFLLPVVLLSSSYQGFDGMIMNGLQLLPGWQQGGYTGCAQLPQLLTVVIRVQSSHWSGSWAPQLHPDSWSDGSNTIHSHSG